MATPRALNRSLIHAALAAVIVLLPVSAHAGVINFNNPDLVLDTGDCRAGPNQQPGDIGTGVMERYIEQGVHFDIWNEARFFSGIWRHPCDPFQLATDPLDGARRYVIVEPEGHTFSDMIIFAGDVGRIEVTSLSGAAITGFQFSAFGGTGQCGVVVPLNIPLCPGLLQDIVFADYGFPLGSLAFTVRYPQELWGFASPRLRLTQLTVPEPATLLLLALAVPLVARRRVKIA